MILRQLSFFFTNKNLLILPLFLLKLFGSASSTQYVIRGQRIYFHLRLNAGKGKPVPMRGEWPSGLYSLRKVTEVKLGRVRSDFGWVTSED